MFRVSSSKSGTPFVIFQLVFKDEIPSNGNRHQRDTKQGIRQAFHVYLRNVWKNEKLLSKFLDGGLPTVPYPVKRSAPDDDKHPFYRAELCGFSWVPLVTKRNRLRVDLEIEILGDSPRVLKPSGDIDNRLKVILDGLRMVRQPSEIESDSHGKGSDLFVLLEDDSLIRNLEVVTKSSWGSPAEHRVTIDVKLAVEDWERHPALLVL